jgi:protease-4
MAETYLDDIIDRRRLRRKLTFWRAAAVIAVLACIAAIVSFTAPEDTLGAKARPHIAKVRVEGTITEDEELLGILDEVAESKAVRGVIITVDSPGGTTVGGEAIYEAVRRLADEKPVTAQIGTVGASAAYMIASATDHIVARQTSIVGSIGVILQYPNITELLDSVGVDVRRIKSTPLKGEPSMTGPPVPGSEEMMHAMILDSYDWFKDIVETRRGLSVRQVAELADGSVFTGRQALENKLVDELGGEEAAKGWLVSEGLDEDLKIVEWKKPDPAESFLLGRALSEWLGLYPLSQTPAYKIADRLLLDGLISVWHVDG